MKKITILIPLFIFIWLLLTAQTKVEIPFSSGNDTIFDTTFASSDTIDCQLGVSELAMGPWQELSNAISDNDTVYITGDDKDNQRTKVYYLAAESWWSFAPLIRFRIRAEDDTLTGNMISMGNYEGASTLFVQPSKVGDATKDTIIYLIRFGTR